jgi:hypothetical protein
LRLLGDVSHWILGAALVAGLALRLWGLDFGLPHTGARPDESILVHRALAIAGGQLNPQFFNYPSFHFYLLSGLFGFYYLLAQLSGVVDSTQAFLVQFLLDPSGLYLAGRLLTALMGTATIACCWHLGRVLGGPVGASASAILLCSALLHVRDSHFLTVDVPATFWVMASLSALIVHTRRGGRAHLLLGASLAGLAMSTKYNAALFLPAMILAVWRSPNVERRRDLLLLLSVSGFTFLLGSPFIALDPGGFWQGFIFEWQHFGRGHGGLDLGNGWFHHLSFTLRHGMGLPLLLASLFSLVWLLRRRRAEDLVLLTAILGYFAVAGAGESLFLRYAIPLVPLLCVATGTWLANLLRNQMGVAVAISMAMILPSTLQVIQHDRLLATEDTRQLASKWIEARIPSGSRIALTGSDYGHPRLRPSKMWLQQRWEDARSNGQAGRRLRLALDTPGYPPKPAFDLVELQLQRSPGLRSVLDLEHLAQLRAEGVDWLVTQSHPLAYAGISSVLAEELESLQPVVEFSPGPPGILADAAFDPLDAYFVPIAGQSGMHRPGPHLRIYQLDPP